jgi:cytoskeletal protein RodZ
MSTVAEQLRNARQARNLSIEQVADMTKMRADQVRALEQGDFGSFSAPVYLRGSVRTYSTLLKLDVPSIMTALDDELGQSRSAAETAPRTADGGGMVDSVTLKLSRLDWRKGAAGLITVLLLVLVVIGYFAWRTARNSDPLKDLEPGVYKPAQESGPTLPLPKAPNKQ